MSFSFLRAVIELFFVLDPRLVLKLADNLVLFRLDFFLISYSNQNDFREVFIVTGFVFLVLLQFRGAIMELKNETIITGTIFERSCFTIQSFVFFL